MSNERSAAMVRERDMVDASGAATFRIEALRAGQLRWTAMVASAPSRSVLITTMMMPVASLAA